MAQEKPGKKVIAQNREAHHEYFVIEALETGVELVGTEVKSLRAGGVNLKDSWADIDDGEIILKGMHISPYEQGNIFNKDPRRPRRLLAHKSEIRHLQQQIKLQGYTLVPLQLACAKAKSCTISVLMPPHGTPSAILTAQSKQEDNFFAHTLLFSHAVWFCRIALIWGCNGFDGEREA